MVDNINLNRMIPSLSSAESVKPVERKRDHSRQTPFKETLKARKRKKKKKQAPEDSKQSTQPADTDPNGQSGDTARQGPEGIENPTEAQPKKIIDIRI